MGTVRPLRVPSLDLLKGFVAVGRHLSITRAAGELHLTQSAVSRQIQALEESLAIRLFVRGHRSLNFTAEGEQLFRAVEPALRRIQEAFETLRPAERPVTITASVGVTTLWLLPRLQHFQDRHPEVDLRVTALNRVADLKREGIDLGIRYCTRAEAPPEATLLFEERVAVVACPALALGRIKSARDLETLVLLEYEDPQCPWLQWQHWLDRRGWGTVRPRGVLRFNQYDQAVIAAMSGQGVVLGRLPLLSHQIERKLLVVARTPPSREPEPLGYWLVQAEAAPREAVRQAIEWILAEAHQSSRRN